MIPDFKTYINESVWGDLHSRGIGETEREEDDVNLLDLDGLVDYIKENYKSTTSKWYINDLVSYDKVYKNLCITLCELQSRYYGYLYFIHEIKSPIITIDNSFFNDDKNLLKVIEKKYTVINNTHYIKVEPKNFTGEITNKFFLEVLDFIIENIPKKQCLLKKKDINESIWADLYSRGIGELEREEDDINHMDPESLCDYLKSKYDVVDEYDDFYCSNNSFRAPVFKYDVGIHCGLAIHNFSQENRSLELSIKYIFEFKKGQPVFWKNLNKTYSVSVKDSTTAPGWTEINISPKGNRQNDNEFFCEVLDFLLDNIDDTPSDLAFIKLLKKKE